MPKKTTKRVMRGASIWGDIWDGVKSAANTVLPILKSVPIASTLANATGRTGLASGLRMAGLGKRKQTGRGKKRSVIKT